MRQFGIGAALLALLATAGPAAAACRLGLTTELPVVMDGNQPLVRGAINGQPMLALADTGAFSSLVWRGAAERYGLPVRPLRGLTIEGVGGSREAQATTLRELKLGEESRKNLQVLMAGWNRPLGRSQVAMILGQDILSHSDVEFDLAKGMIRFVRPLGCTRTDSLAYWGGDYSEASIEPVSREAPHIIVPVVLNGRRMRAMLDTGAWTTVVTTNAAARAGVRQGSAETEASGRSSGVGKRSVSTALATFDTLQIGDQTIQKPRLRIANLFGGGRRTTGSRLASSSDDVDLILGADFFRAHRVLVSYSQQRVVFSYTGGRIFQVEGPPLGAELEPGDKETPAKP